MKNILKKLGVFGIIVALIAPFTELPKVNAAESCERHLQSYLFIDVINGGEAEVYVNGYRTLTSYLYTFPEISSSQTLKIESTELYPLDDYEDLENYWNTYNELASSHTSEDIDFFGTYDTQSFKNEDYKTKTTILHGVWARENDMYDESNHTLPEISYGYANDEDTFSDHTMQGVLLNKNINQTNFLNVTTGGGTLVNEQFYVATEYSAETGKFLQLLVDDTIAGDSNSLDRNYLWKYDGDLYLNLNIRRQISESNLNKLVFGYLNTETKKYLAFSTSDSEVVNSFSALKKSETSTEIHYIEVEKEEIDIRTEQAYYWPVILNVEYSVCTNAEEAKQWTLKYDENVTDNSVTNMPNPKTETLDAGVSATVSSTKPERKNYTFDEWCTESNGGGTCYSAGEEVKNSGVSTEVVLFAQWKEVGTTENKKTGVVSYIIGFAAVGVVAGGIYLIAKKKNLFKQI